MTKRELVDKIEKVYEMIITVSGRMFRIRRDEEDCLIILSFPISCTINSLP